MLDNDWSTQPAQPQVMSSFFRSRPALIISALLLAVLPALNHPLFQHTAAAQTSITISPLDTLSQAMARHLSCYPLDILEIKNNRPQIAQRDFCLASIYHETGAQPLWVDKDGPGRKASIIRQRLRSADEEGIDPRNYDLEHIDRLWNSVAPDDLAELDTLITFNLVKYIHDMSFGQIKIRLFDPDLFAEAGDADFDPVQSVELALSTADLGTFLDGLVPRHRYYLDLKKALADYRTRDLGSDWPKIPSGPLIRPGSSDERLPLILKRLAGSNHESGDYRENPEEYHQELVDTITAYQLRHGLEADGIIGPMTLEWLNKTPEEQVEIIKLNMARWRWHAHELGDNHIMVNIAAFSLTAVRDVQTALEMPVIVGKLQHQTPVFSDTIRYLDFNPYWNIPPSIARNEELPALQKNPRHLVERHVRLFSDWQSDAFEINSLGIDWSTVSRAQMSRYKLRQDPGPWNALGRVKFVFPNKHAVYLHNTPAHDLFEHASRSFSHGCIRVRRPLELALFCLDGQKEKWSMEAIEQIVENGERTVVSLTEKLPIHITYQTAWVDNQGEIHFNRDIYGRDKRLQEALAADNVIIPPEPRQ